MSLDYYSEVFKKLLLHNVVIKCGTKTCRAGKIQNFDIKQFYVKLYIENVKNNIKVLELPYPYTISYKEKTTTLNYHTTSFCDKNTDTHLNIKLINSRGASKYFDNNIEIITID
jgi:hypothetical protein